MPSRRHQLLAYAVPRVRRSCDLVDEPAERARVERWGGGLDRSLPTRHVSDSDCRWSEVTEEVVPVHVLTPRPVARRRTLLRLHGGGHRGRSTPARSATRPMLPIAPAVRSALRQTRELRR